MPKLVEIGIDALFAALRDSEHRALVDLMVSLLRRNAYSPDDFLTGVHSKTDQLDDLRCGLRALWHSHTEDGHILTHGSREKFPISLLEAAVCCYRACSLVP
jgi:hypothetical protein